MPVELAIVLTAVFSVSFQPVREWLRALADRWVFGPSRSDLGYGLEQHAAVNYSEGDAVAAVQRLAQLVRAAVRLQWVTVSLPPHLHCSAGTATGKPVLVVDLIVDDAPAREICCRPKLSGRLSERDERLVTALGNQFALAVANRRLAGRLVQVQEGERRRIGRNLHDGAQQQLVALIAQLGLARRRAHTSPPKPELLDDLQQQVQAILREVRDLAQGIHPAVLTDAGLVEAVEDRCNRLPIRIEVNASAGLRRTRFNDDVEGAAYFFVAECLTNILKHAQAESARIDLEQQGRELELTVTDDGIGFDAARTGAGGLAGLADRLKALGGSLSVTSTHDVGTEVQCRLPVNGVGGHD